MVKTYENKKYELLDDDTITTPNGTTLYRICALRKVGNKVRAGDLGGYIQSEKNLSHGSKDGDDAWVFDNAWVFGNANVHGHAQILGNARIFDDADISGYARISNNAWVFGRAKIENSARVSDTARIFAFYCHISEWHGCMQH